MHIQGLKINGFFFNVTHNNTLGSETHQRVYLSARELSPLWQHPHNNTSPPVIAVIASRSPLNMLLPPHDTAGPVYVYSGSHRRRTSTSRSPPSLRVCHKHNILRPFQQLRRIIRRASRLQMLDGFHAARLRCELCSAA